MKTQVLMGRFLNSEGESYSGEVRFMPLEMWEVIDEVAYARLAPTVQLDDGRFEAEVNLGLYMVYTPIGQWKIRVVETQGASFLVNHLPSRFQ